METKTNVNLDRLIKSDQVVSRKVFFVLNTSIPVPISLYDFFGQKILFASTEGQAYKQFLVAGVKGVPTRHPYRLVLTLFLSKI